MISTAFPFNLPEPGRFRQICKSVSVLDAVLSKSWIKRCYTYNSKWSKHEEFCGMMSDVGDLLILFCVEGCVVNGMVHEYYPKDKGKITKGLPASFHPFMFGEPVHSIGTTFCLWNNGNSWESGQIEDYQDGSLHMLKMFDDNPQTYIDWASVHYGDHFLKGDKTLEIVSLIYNQRPLEKSMIFSLVSSMDHWEQLEADLQEIDYPYSW